MANTTYKKQVALASMGRLPQIQAVQSNYVRIKSTFLAFCSLNLAERSLYCWAMLSPSPFSKSFGVINLAKKFGASCSCWVFPSTSSKCVWLRSRFITFWTFFIHKNRYLTWFKAHFLVFCVHYCSPYLWYFLEYKTLNINIFHLLFTKTCYFLNIFCIFCQRMLESHN